MKEKDLFPPLKKYFKDLGYNVYVEVPAIYRPVDFVAVRGDDHIAVEMKLSFNRKVIQQANNNQRYFGKSYVAFPVRHAKIFDLDEGGFVINHNDGLHKVSDKNWTNYGLCVNEGIGILEVVGKHQNIFEALEAEYKKPYQLYDFSLFEENENDEAGLPSNKGISAASYEVKLIRRYILTHPDCTWKEIFENVQNHYSSARSLAGSMLQYQGFDLNQFKNLHPEIYIPRNHNG